MLDQLGSLFRKASFALIPVGLLAAFYVEGLKNIPTGRGGRLKPPIAQQRLTYLTLIGSALPGVAWGFVRAARGDQRMPWE